MTYHSLEAPASQERKGSEDQRGAGVKNIAESATAQFFFQRQTIPKQKASNHSSKEAQVKEIMTDEEKGRYSRYLQGEQRAAAFSYLPPLVPLITLIVLNSTHADEATWKFFEMLGTKGYETLGPDFYNAMFDSNMFKNGTFPEQATIGVGYGLAMLVLTIALTYTLYKVMEKTKQAAQASLDHSYKALGAGDTAFYFLVEDRVVQGYDEAKRVSDEKAGTNLRPHENEVRQNLREEIVAELLKKLGLAPQEQAQVPIANS